jgi:hypothetical protein
VTYILDGRDIQHQLHSNSCDKLASITNISAASQEEEASSKPAQIEVATRDNVHNHRFACSGHAAWPEEALLVFIISPL